MRWPVSSARRRSPGQRRGGRADQVAGGDVADKLGAVVPGKAGDGLLRLVQHLDEQGAAAVERVAVEVAGGGGVQEEVTAGPGQRLGEQLAVLHASGERDEAGLP